MKNNLVKIELIENYMKMHGLSKTAFCRLCKISPCTFEKIKNNGNYKIVALFKIGKIMKTSIRDFFDD